MQNRKGNYEKVLLGIAVVIALGIAGYLIWSSKQIEERLALRPASSRNLLQQPPKANVDAALARIQEKISWVSPVIKGKPVPLNKSIQIYRKDGQIYDLLVPEPVFRPPFPNEYLVNNKLPNIDVSNFAALDPDGDGFTNLEEFNAKTNPMDKSNHPPVTDKLFLKQRISHDYILRLNSSNPPYLVQRIKPEPKVGRFVSLTEANGEFGFEKDVIRFKALSWEQKAEKNPATGLEKDVSELTVRDLSTNKEFKLVKGVDYNLVEYDAEFEFLLAKGGADSTRKVKQGETFQIPGLGVTYKVLEIEEDKAVIAPVLPDGKTGETLTVPKK